MNTPDRTRINRRRLLEAAGLAALLLFGAAVLYVPKDRVDLVYDSSSYGAQSINLAQGRGNTVRMGGEDVPGYYPPGYPLLIVPFHWILGYDIRNGIHANLFYGLLALLWLYFLARKAAGPAAGAAALLALLKSRQFIFTTQHMLSQTPTIMVLVAVVWLMLRGWEGRRGTGALAFAAGLLAGLSVFVRNINITFAAGVALFALFFTRDRTRSRITSALPACLGVALAGALVMAYNAASYGSPFRTGDMGWVDMGNRFSPKYFFHPTYTPLGKGTFPLLRSLFGLGPIYPWVAALPALLGLPLAWRVRKRNPAYFRLYGITILCTAVNVLILAFYFMRSELYVMLTVPLVLACAASTLALLLRRLHEARVPRIAGKIPAGAVLLILGLLYVFCWGGPPRFRAWEQEKPRTPNITLFQEADAIIEPNGLLVGSANPVLAEYLFVKDTQRTYLFITNQASKPLQRLLARELGEEKITVEGVERYVRDKLGRGIPVYFKIYLFQPKDRALAYRVFRHLKKRFTFEKTKAINLFRVLP